MSEEKRTKEEWFEHDKRAAYENSKTLERAGFKPEVARDLAHRAAERVGKEREREGQ